MTLRFFSIAMAILSGCGTSNVVRRVEEAPVALSAVADSEVVLNTPQAEQLTGSSTEIAPLVAPVDSAWLQESGCGEIGVFCAARRTGDVLLVERWSSGNGVDAGHSHDVRIYREGQLRLIGNDDSIDGAYVSAFRFDRPLDQEALQLWSELMPAIVEPASMNGRAQLFLGAKREPRVYRGSGFSVVGPLYRPGDRTLEEECQPSVYRHGRELHPQFVQTNDAPENAFRWDEYEREGQVLRVAGLECPPMTERVGPYRVRIFELWGRNRGVAIAVSGEDQRFRWAIETRNAVLGSDVQWIGAARGWLFARTRSLHPGYLYEGRGALVALRVADGLAVRIDVPALYEDQFVPRDEEREVARQECVSALWETIPESEDTGEEITLGEQFRAQCEAELPTRDGMSLDDEGLHLQRLSGDWHSIPASDLFSLLDRVEHRDRT